MNIVDSSGWLSYFAGDENAGAFAGPIENANQLLVPSITITEVFKRILQQVSENAALHAIAHMQRAKVIALDSRLAIDAATCGHELKLPLADSIIYATARAFDAVVWTQDADFENLQRVKFFPANTRK